MGWTFNQGATKADIIRQQTATYDNTDHVNTMVAKRIVGNHLWQVRALVNPDGTERERYILLSLLAGDRNYGWGCKEVDEGMGPCEEDCPLALLDMCPPSTSEYAAGWRDRVRAHHAAKTTKRDLLRTLAVGDTVTLFASCSVPSLRITSLKPLRGVYGGTLYRIPASYIVSVQSLCPAVTA